MLRRSTRSGTTLDQSKKDLARRETELGDQMEKLGRMMADAPKVAEKLSRQQREELFMRASEGRGRLDVSTALPDPRYGEVGGGEYRRRSLRKERREGR